MGTSIQPQQKTGQIIEELLAGSGAAFLDSNVYILKPNNKLKAFAQLLIPHTNQYNGLKSHL